MLDSLLFPKSRLPFEVFEAFESSYTRASEIFRKIHKMEKNQVFLKVRNSSITWQTYKFHVKMLEAFWTVKPYYILWITEGSQPRKDARLIDKYIRYLWDRLGLVSCPRFQNLLHIAATWTPGSIDYYNY